MMVSSKRGRQQQQQPQQQQQQQLDVLQQDHKAEMEGGNAAGGGDDHDEEEEEEGEEKEAAAGSGHYSYYDDDDDDDDDNPLHTANQVINASKMARQVVVRCVRKVFDDKLWLDFFAISKEPPLVLFAKLLNEGDVMTAALALQVILRFHGPSITCKAAECLEEQISSRVDASTTTGSLLSQKDQRLKKQISGFCKNIAGPS